MTTSHNSYSMNGQTVGVVYVDCAKTFDQIDFVVISGQGNTDNLVRLIHTFLTRHKRAVQANGARSQPTEVKYWIAQSEVCRTILFLILIEDNDRKAAKAYVFNSADDTRVSLGVI